MRLSGLRRYFLAAAAASLLALGLFKAPASAGMMCYEMFIPTAWYADDTPDGYYVGSNEVLCFYDGNPWDTVWV
jgi:hypothetical protein